MSATGTGHSIANGRVSGAFVGYDGVRLVAELPFPPSTNHLYANAPHSRKRVLTKEGKEYKRSVQQLLFEQKAWKNCPRPPFELGLWYYLPDNRKRDLSNLIKAVEDALSTYLHYDDSCHHDVHLHRVGVDRENPRVVVTLEPAKAFWPVPVRSDR